MNAVQTIIELEEERQALLSGASWMDYTDVDDLLRMYPSIRVNNNDRAVLGAILSCGNVWEAMGNRVINHNRTFPSYQRDGKELLEFNPNYEQMLAFQSVTFGTNQLYAKDIPTGDGKDWIVFTIHFNLLTRYDDQKFEGVAYNVIEWNKGNPDNRIL